MNYLVLVRHGQSMWNIANKFTGWVDVALTEKGLYEALIAAEELQGIRFDIAYTSTLIRAHQTLCAILSKQERVAIFIHEDAQHQRHALHPEQYASEELPVFSHEALNERWYGELQGMAIDEARRQFSEEQVFVWRRSWDVAPPGGESLKDTYERVIPYLEQYILPQIQQGKNVLIAAHGNSLRAIIKYLEQISDEEIPQLELPTGKPIIYGYNNNHYQREEHLRFDRPLHWSPQ